VFYSLRYAEKVKIDKVRVPIFFEPVLQPRSLKGKKWTEQLHLLFFLFTFGVFVKLTGLHLINLQLKSL